MTDEGSTEGWAAGPSSQDKNMAAVVNISALAGAIMPFGAFIAPFIVWSLNRDRSELIDDHGRAAVNFNLSMYVYTLVFFLLWFVFFLMAPGRLVFMVSVVPAVLLALVWLILVVVNTVRAARGERAAYIIAVPFFRA